MEPTTRAHIPTESEMQRAAARCLHSSDRERARADFSRARSLYEAAVSLPEPSMMDITRAREMNPARDW
jgi:hypothetical protein